jgi:hypothetical protein
LSDKPPTPPGAADAIVKACSLARTSPAASEVPS